MTPDLATTIGRVCDLAAEIVAGTPLADTVAPIRDRLTGPLRVALAGRVKAGKSTLLNALVGEKLAPTDAGECTRLVSWYREGLGYDVAAVTRDGERHDLRFTRGGGALDVDLGGLAVDAVQRLEIGWPSSALRTVTLIDTPGLASLTAENSLRTVDVLAPDDDQPGQADAVVYLMRHLHRHDADFLETFQDRTLANASPVNAIAVLSRADELGAGRLDALDSAARIAGRYRDDPRIRSLAVTVVPVAGLIAETGLTLREDEYASLRTLATMDAEAREALLLSVDHAVDPDRAPLAPEIRAELLLRLGLFGVRFAVAAIADGRVSSSADLSRLLVAASGLDDLRDLLNGHFMARAQGLKGRSALAALRDLASRVARTDPGAGARLAAAVEEVEATTHVFAELRLVHLVLSRSARLTDDERDEALRATGGGDPAERLGLGPDAPSDAVRAAALAAVERWRTRRASPMTDPVTAEACDVLARTYEGLYAGVAAG